MHLLSFHTESLRIRSLFQSTLGKINRMRHRMLAWDCPTWNPTADFLKEYNPALRCI